MTTREQFLAERAHALGGSDIEALVGVGYGCPRALWYDKAGHPADFPFLGNRHTERGTVLEPAALDVFCKESGMTVRDRQVWRTHPRWPRLGCHVDGLLYTAKEPERNPGVLEVKCPTRFAWQKFRLAGPSHAQVLQVQWNMLITGCQWGVLWAFCADCWEGHAVYLARDEPLVQDLENLALLHIASWREQENPHAKLDPTQDGRCLRCPWRWTCQGLGPLHVPDEPPGQANAEREDESLAEAVSDYAAARVVAKEAEANLELARAKLQNLLPEPGCYRCSAGKVQYTESYRKAYTVPAKKLLSLRVYTTNPNPEDNDEL